MSTTNTTYIKRFPLLAHRELRSFYRYNDLFQLVPASLTDPRPTELIGMYGLTLEYVMEPVAPDRETDKWAHDHRERQRMARLRKGVKSPPNDSWLDADKEIRQQLRSSAIPHEVARLLSVLSDTLFEEPLPSKKVWVLEELDTWKVRWAQTSYPSFATGPTDSFSTATGQRIELVDPSEYYNRNSGYGPGDPVVDLPTDIDHRLGTYFDLKPTKKLAMARACELLGVARDTWLTSRSVSLVGAVIAVETLIHADDPAPVRCTKCNSLLSTNYCNDCGSPVYGLTRRFRDFVESHVESNDVAANRLYEARSDIVHRGQLLRSDEFDSGFNLGGKDNQQSLAYAVTTTVRTILVRWLEEQAESNR